MIASLKRLLSLARGGSIFAEKDGGLEGEVAVIGYSATAVMHGYAADGSKTEPKPLEKGRLLFGIGSRPWIGKTFAPHSTAALHWLAREPMGPGNQGTTLGVVVTPLGTDESKRKFVFWLESDGVDEGTRFRFNGNGKPSERLYFQSKNAELADTTFGVLPSAPGGASSFAAFNAPDPENAASITLSADADIARVSSRRSGQGAALPIDIEVGDDFAARIEPGLVSFRDGERHAGSIVVSGKTAIYGTPADYRLATAVEQLNGSLTRLNKLTPRHIQHNDGEWTAGFLAHEFSEVYPSSVHGQKDAVDQHARPAYQSLDAGSPEVIADIVSAVQDISRRLAALEQASKGNTH